MNGGVDVWRYGLWRILRRGKELKHDVSGQRRRMKTRRRRNRIFRGASGSTSAP